MNNNNKLVALMLGAFVMAGFNSCSDDHFDVVGSGSNSHCGRQLHLLRNCPTLRR